MCLTGCFTIDTAPLSSTGEEHVMMSNWGCRLFGCLPLFSGNASEDALTQVAFFRDDVTMEKVQARFTAYANGREIVCPVYHNFDKNIFTLFGIPIPYVLCYKEITLSGTLK